MIPQLLGRNGHLLMPILALLLMNLPVAEAKLELPEGSMGNFAIIGLIFGAITFVCGKKHMFIRWFRILFGRRPILSDVEGHERQRVSREWYFYANWLTTELPPAPSHALAEAAAARVIDVERQLFEEMPPPPRALPVRLFKSLFRTAKSFFPPATSGDDSTNENNSRTPPQPQIPRAHVHGSATTPQELGILHFQSFEFNRPSHSIRRSILLAVLRKLANSPKDGGKIGIHYAGYKSRPVRRSRKSTHKRTKCLSASRLCGRLLRALEEDITPPNSTIIRGDKGKAPEQPRKLAPNDGGKVGYLYSGYTPKPVPRLRSTHRRSKYSAKIKGIFPESKLVSHLLRAVENGFTPATSIDELTRENTRRNKGKAPERGTAHRHKHRHRPKTATKDGGKNAIHGPNSSGRRPRRSTHHSANSARRPRKSTHRHKSATTLKDGGKVGILYAGYTPKPVPRLRSAQSIFLLKLFNCLHHAVENVSATPNSTISRRDKGKAPEPRILPQLRSPRRHRFHRSAKFAHRPRKSTHGLRSEFTTEDGGLVGIHYAGYAFHGRKSAYTAKTGGKIGIHYAGYTPKSKRRHTESAHESRTYRSRSSNRHTAGKTPKREQQDLIIPPPKAHTAATSRESEQQDLITPPPEAHFTPTSSKHVEMAPEPATASSHHRFHVTPSPLIKFADAINPHRRAARRPVPSALISVLDLGHTISRKPVPSASYSSTTTTPHPSHTIPRKPVPSASRT